jgi:hypothetical protein
MNTTTAPTVEELLRPPPSFERRDFTAYLFRPYSIKERREVSLYTPGMYALWLRLESDPEVKRFNSEVQAVPIAVGTTAVNAAPRCVSVHVDGTVTIHTFKKVLAPEEVPRPDELNAASWEAWATERGFKHKAWTPDDLFGEEVYLANLGQLLGYTSRPGFVPDPDLEQRILSELKGFRKTTVAKLSQLFPRTDPELFYESLASLLVRQKIHSDVRREPFSMLTMVSAFREVSEP